MLGRSGLSLESGVSASLGDGGLALLLVDGLEELIVLLLVSDLLGKASSLLVDLLATAAESDGGDEALNLGCNGAVTLSLLSGDGTANDELADVVFLAQVEELADARGTLGTEALGDGLVGDIGDLLLSLLYNDDVDYGHLRGDDASADRLAAAISLAAVDVVAGSSVEQQTNSVRRQYSLLHRKSLLVESSSYAEHISLVLISQEIA